jgi:riboflavin synthase alpha subunit
MYFCPGGRKVGDQVNLERAMGAHVRFGGHFVQVWMMRVKMTTLSVNP